MTNLIKLKNRIKKNEGFVNKVYFDQLGYATIGFGHLIKKKENFDPNKSYSKKHLLKIFEKDFSKAVKLYNKNFSKHNFRKNIKEFLIEMIFQLGISKTLKFKKLIKSLTRDEPFLASLEMMNSIWYLQTPKRVLGHIKLLAVFENDKKKRK